ncbi:hypothetical protein Salat_2436700 [Sesamum alatum]|uniref:Uncharacterized protein n=1 Tax=Sesamum alatum TaxID=300844 RepID=A0AAE1XZ18_9LAMI|nr:hypothetical protein Salat_2436700 [Sesamum alatum]
MDAYMKNWCSENASKVFNKRPSRDLSFGSCRHYPVLAADMYFFDFRLNMVFATVATTVAQLHSGDDTVCPSLHGAGVAPLLWGDGKGVGAAEGMDLWVGSGGGNGFGGGGSD